MKQFNSEFKDNASQSIGLSFIKTYNLWHRAIKDKLALIKLTHPQFIVLAALGYLSQNKGEVTQIAISRQSDIDVMTVSTIIRNLEKAHLVIRLVSKEDSRAKTVKLTDTGQIILDKALPMVEEVDTQFFSALNFDKSLFNELLLKLIDNNLQ
ncbi:MULTISPECIES: MarR family winged helix-turn-helix transcriptional regulator [unclassified Enterococcus]|uniref:MarR family winged helix-turn-helix transcriptional regulator n=1 Tax=unclassified Enterococcus TaxID=2608891 RepID=UPI0015572166|nr:MULTISPECIES: MarR family winged helix-turn-helix transcriptional regulator [unclassified Enterococcus]MBS7577457.1 winged helix-turn-helix transcriptional regulator [Enterococcus sp. MMGLQ5-2]MBS7584863.1 winged helix-turn-helix transcriptional regulator [Enterococcus sp. MMGLQ5-1]NPD12718.1 winged helix-turn-helix transcriptional regulator [Enterococcus sp. MMGLQ5-1]NPD37289.1 winged helix-turn-helix transcriptional regulator [Enterococcus sp. MMGLQ5-2]